MSYEQQGLVLPEPENRLALVIGVNSAPNAQTPLLKTELQASNDAVAMAEVLQECCGFKLLMPPLLGLEATSAKVKRAILQLARQRTEQDFLLLYFAGHGYPMIVSGNQDDIYLGTYDFDDQEVEEDEHTHCSMRWLRDHLYIPTNAGKVLIVLDCCYAGHMGRTAPDPYLEDLQARINTYFDAPGATSGSRPNGLRQALAATGHNQTAGEEGEHGRFTGLVLKALRGQVDEVIDLANHGHVNLRLLQNYLQRVMQGGQRSSLSGGDAGKDCILAQYEQRAEELRQLRRTQVNEQPSSYIPFNRIASFQPRPGEFEKVTQLLMPDTSAETHAPIVVGLVGMGGSGKTHLAVELAYTYKDAKRFPGGIFWLPVTEISQQGLAHQLAGLAANALYLPPGDNVSHPENEENRARHLCRYLVTHADALLILDNVDQIRQVLDLLPCFAGEALRCTILYTSRNEEAPSYVQTYRVEGLTKEGALHLLLEYRSALLARVLADQQSVEAQIAHAICQHVERLPLALTLLRDLLQDEHLTMELLWQEQQQRGIFEITSNEPDILKARLFRTFEQSWQKVETDDAQRLFLLASCFPEAVPLPLWVLSILADLPGNNTSLDRLGKARRMLQHWSLIEVLPNDAIRLHPLLCEFGSYLLQHKVNAQDLFAQASKQLNDEFININRLEQRARAKGYWNCLADVQSILNYARMINLKDADLLGRIEYWLARDSSLLGDNAWWPDRFPGLFHQQLYNRAIEEGFSLPGNPASNAPWLRQMQPAGIREQLLLRELRHPAAVMSVAFSPDNHRLATGCENGIAYIWDVASGRMLQQLRGHTDLVSNVVFSPDGQILATSSNDSTARTWDLESGQQLHIFQGHTASLNSVVFSHDGKRIATTSQDCTTRVWDTTTEQTVAFLAHEREMTDMAFSPNGLMLATHTSSRNDTNEMALYDSDDTNEMALYYNNGLVVLWNIEREEIIFTKQKDDGGSVAFSSDGHYVFYNEGNESYRWDLTGGSIDKCFRHGLIQHALGTFSPDSTYLAVLSPFSPPPTTKIELWQTSVWPTDAQVRWHKYQHNNTVYDAAISPDNTKLAVACDDDTALLWAIPSVPEAQDSSMLVGDLFHKYRLMHFSYDGSRLLTISVMPKIMLWEVATRKLLHTSPAYLSASWNTVDAALSPDNMQIAIRWIDSLWMEYPEQERKYQDFQTGSMEFSIDSFHQADYTSSIVFSPDGEVLIACLEPQTASIWDTHKKQFTGTLSGHSAEISSVVFSPNGRHVLTGSYDGNVLIWDRANYQRIGTLPGHQGGVKSLTVSPDNALVASSALDGSIYLWSLANSRRLAIAEGHSGGPAILSFSSDNHLLISADASRQVRFWRIDKQQQLVLAGLYSTPHEVKAAYWYNPRHILLASDDGEQGKPCFYHLALEGTW